MGSRPSRVHHSSICIIICPFMHERQMDQPAAVPTLNYRAVALPARRWAVAIRFCILVVAVLAIHVAAICLFNPVFELRDWLGGGALGTPFAPIDTSLPNDQIQRAYRVQACA